VLGVELARRTASSGIVSFLIIIIAIAAGCDKSPSEPFARLVEQAESWAATVRYAGQLRDSGQVPDAYFKEVLTAARQDLEKLDPQFAKARHISQNERTAALTLADNLKSLLGTDAPDQARISEVEARLHELAAQVRGS
jgi:hypothetical protein